LNALNEEKYCMIVIFCLLCWCGLYFNSLINIIMITEIYCVSGTSGADDDHVFISSGVNVRLSCNNALSGCKSTTWIYNRFSHSGTVGLIELGIKKDTERHERLSLESDCSLNIKNVTEEDYGLYTCRQYVNGQDHQPETDAPVYLHVLHGKFMMIYDYVVNLNL